ncbi:uncharacterized protein LOC141851332 isoform X2 [Brevipalpus obovatus]|uniref:uncharacterized protein LOC141851332 isoform X2 n=1 Tax=Brevipalpus obovatus TaxID=246614 RepID=UPI003D9F5351
MSHVLEGFDLSDDIKDIIRCPFIEPPIREHLDRCAFTLCLIFNNLGTPSALQNWILEYILESIIRQALGAKSITAENFKTKLNKLQNCYTRRSSHHDISQKKRRKQ